jgi:transglutaminase-like putative cysteine protease
MTRASATPVPTSVPLATLRLLLAAYLAGALLNLHHAALWVFPVAAVAAAWRWRAARAGGRQLPGRPARYATLVALTLAVLATFRTLNGLAAGATLLVAMGALKLLEATRPRDFAFLAGSALFLLLAACLDAQALWRLPLYAAQLVLCCAALLALARAPEPLAARAALRQAARLLLLAAPLALLLFLFFPRLPGSFWALPDTGDAVTGLSNELEPGAIAELSQLDDPAMRVRFAGTAPPRNARYWRGPVLHDFDGSTWRARSALFVPRPELSYSGPRYEYSVELEPGTLALLPALELPEGSLPAEALLTPDYQLALPRPSRQVLNYTLASRTQYRSAGPLSAAVRHMDLALPRERNPRTLALARELRAAAADERAFITAVLAHLRDGGYAYTLTPQRLGAQPVDEFLFDTRAGFCGHYASAFALLMRAGGVPAHVVTGYQGGEWNPIGGYYLVRQSHAHAWTEVWLDGQGWQRVDPTAVVAPGRLEGESVELLPGATRGGARLLRGLPWIGAVIQGWDALNAWWLRDVVGFDFARQLDLFGALGFGPDGWRTLASVLAGGGIAWALLIVWQARRRARSPPPDPLARAWIALGARLGRAGLRRRAIEGPLDYAERVAAAEPSLAGEVRRLARTYATLRYGPRSDAAAVAAFGRAVRALRIPHR